MYQHKSGSLKRKEKKEREQEEEKTETDSALNVSENITFFEEELDWKDPAVWPDVLQDKDREKVVICGLRKEIELKQMIMLMDKDFEDRQFSEFHLYAKSSNGREKIIRDWLRWSTSKHVLYCVTCLAFTNDHSKANSLLCRREGFDPSKNKWRLLYSRLPEHELSINHKENYWSWRKLQMSIAGHGLDSIVQNKYAMETQKFAALLERLLDVTLYLASRNLAFRGSSQRIGDLHNGNFLGFLEIVAHYDTLLEEHLETVKRSQETGKKMHAHYLSWATQNEFINVCGKLVLDTILSEREKAIYFSVICDATPDISHTEQNVILLRFVIRDQSSEDWIIQERFIEFFDFSQKTGAEIAEKLLSRLEEHGIDIKDCRSQGFDNGANMSGKNKGVRAHIQKKYPKAIFCPCASHSLNLVGVHAASCCPDVSTFFGCVNRLYVLYVLFSKSPERWKILKEEIGSSLHGLSDTRWSARVEAVCPVAKKLPGILKAIEKVLLERKLSSEGHSEAEGLKNYFSKFKALLLATFWIKVLESFEERNKILQSKSISMEIGAENIKALSLEMQSLRDRWPDLLSEAKLVAGEMNIPKILKSRGEAAAENAFKVTVFLVAIDNIISELDQRFQSMKNVCSLFSPILKLRTISDEELIRLTETLISSYSEDLTPSLLGELQHLRKVYDATFENNLGPLDLLNSIYKLQLEGIFGEVCLALRIFITLPLSVAGGERAFSKLSLIKNYLRSTMSEQRLNSLAILSIEHELARKLNFKDLIQEFASLKLRRWSTRFN